MEDNGDMGPSSVFFAPKITVARALEVFSFLYSCSHIHWGLQENELRVMVNKDWSFLMGQPSIPTSGYMSCQGF